MRDLTFFQPCIERMVIGKGHTVCVYFYFYYPFHARLFDAVPKTRWR